MSQHWHNIVLRVCVLNVCVCVCVCVCVLNLNTAKTFIQLNGHNDWLYAINLRISLKLLLSNVFCSSLAFWFYSPHINSSCTCIYWRYRVYTWHDDNPTRRASTNAVAVVLYHHLKFSGVGRVSVPTLRRKDICHAGSPCMVLFILQPQGSYFEQLAPSVSCHASQSLVVQIHSCNGC